MAEFVLYSYSSGEPLAAAFQRHIEPGETFNLDGIDGFHDQFFDGYSASGGDTIRFVPVEAPRWASLDAPETLERLPVIEATILNCSTLGGLVRVDRVEALGHWAREVPLGSEEVWSAIPTVARPPDVVQRNLVQSLMLGEPALWRSGPHSWRDPNRLTTIYLFKAGEQARCLILTENGSSSYVVSAEGLLF